MDVVRLTKFIKEPKFLKAVESFGHAPAAKVTADVDDFEEDWRMGMEEDQLYSQYNFKPLKIDRPYKLFQIRVGPNRRNVGYRATLMFYKGQLLARWIHAFKKEAMSEQQEINLAVTRADESWERINK